MSKQCIAIAFFRCAYLSCYKHSIDSCGWKCAVQDLYMSAEGDEVVPAYMGIVIRRDEVYKDVLQSDKMVDDECLTLLEVLWVSHKLGCLPVAKVKGNSLIQHGRSIFLPLLEYALLVIKRDLLLCFIRFVKFEDFNSLFPDF